MSDIFREVEEDVRRERFEKIWKAYGVYLIALAVLILAAVGGYQVWQRHEAVLRAKSGDAYMAAQRISEPRQAATAFAGIAANGAGNYGLLAKLSQANALYAAGQAGQAVTLYQQIGDADSGEVGAVARLRAAWAMSPSSSRADLEKLLAPLNTPTGAWRQMAQEVLAFSDYRAAKIRQAAGEYQALAADGTSPDALRARARAMAAFLGSGGGSDIGTVPAALPAPPPAPANMTPAPTK